MSPFLGIGPGQRLHPGPGVNILGFLILAFCLSACEAGEIWLDASVVGDGQSDGTLDGSGDGDDGVDGGGDPDGSPSDDCQSNCFVLGSRECLDESAYWECTQVGPCLQWSNAVACATNALCQDGQCTCLGTMCAGACCAPDEVCVQDSCCRPSCAGKECGSDGCGNQCGTCQSGETCADGLCQVAGACAAITCDDLEWCKDGVCRCQSGWERQGADCQAIIPPDPTATTRTEQAVCAKWNSDYADRAQGVWQAGQDDCDPGVLNPESIDDGVRRINLFRWLVGLEPTYNLRSLNEYAQPCAVMLLANNDLNHSPPDTWTCYSSDAATGAGHSNLAMGTGTPASSVSLYVQDPGVASLGHRRWILDPPFKETGIGQASSFNCTYVMTFSNTYQPAFVAYPAPGPFPSQAVMGPWSLGVSSFEQAQVVVTVEDVGSGATQQPQVNFPGGSYGGLSYLYFGPTGISAGNSYQVTVSNVRLVGGSAYETLNYTVDLVSCN